MMADSLEILKISCSLFHCGCLHCSPFEWTDTSKNCFSFWIIIWKPGYQLREYFKCLCSRCEQHFSLLMWLFSKEIINLLVLATCKWFFALQTLCLPCENVEEICYSVIRNTCFPITLFLLLKGNAGMKLHVSRKWCSDILMHE